MLISTFYVPSCPLHKESFAALSGQRPRFGDARALSKDSCITLDRIRTTSQHCYGRSAANWRSVGQSDDHTSGAPKSWLMSTLCLHRTTSPGIWFRKGTPPPPLHPGNEDTEGTPLNKTSSCLLGTAKALCFVQGTVESGSRMIATTTVPSQPWVRTCTAPLCCVVSVPSILEAWPTPVGVVWANTFSASH